jgi:hypothetical protein
MLDVDAVQRFGRIVAVPEPALDRAALALAAGADPDLDERRWLAELDRLATGVTSVDGLVRRLFVDEGFRGNTGRLRRPAQLPAPPRPAPPPRHPDHARRGHDRGGAARGHRHRGCRHARATSWSARPAPPATSTCSPAAPTSAARSARPCSAARPGAGPEVPFGPHLLTAAPVRSILARVLENLRAVYRARQRPRDLEWVLRMRLLLPGVRLTDVLELGRALGDQARWPEGAALLEQRAQGAPAAHAERLRTAARSLRANLN